MCIIFDLVHDKLFFYSHEHYLSAGGSAWFCISNVFWMDSWDACCIKCLTRNHIYGVDGSLRTLKRIKKLILYITNQNILSFFCRCTVKAACRNATRSTSLERSPSRWLSLGARHCIDFQVASPESLPITAMADVSKISKVCHDSWTFSKH